MSAVVELRERLRRYYTEYYRDTLGIPGWPTLVDLRQEEEAQERGHFDRLRTVLGPDALAGRILNVGCGTGGFNAVAAAAGARIVGMDADAEAIAICGAKHGSDRSAYVRAEAERLPFRAARAGRIEVADRLWDRGVCLPSSVGITAQERQAVIDALVARLA